MNTLLYIAKIMPKYQSQNKNKEKFVFLHVSCFDNEAKNTVGIVEATEQLLAIRDDFKVKMVGIGPDFELTKAAANIKGLTNRGIIEFTGELLTEQVAIEMTEADAFILHSLRRILSKRAEPIQLIRESDTGHWHTPFFKTLSKTVTVVPILRVVKV